MFSKVFVVRALTFNNYFSSLKIDDEDSSSCNCMDYQSCAKYVFNKFSIIISRTNY